uniref:ALK and LTK ligand 1 n=1 Tax=Ursus americanus TaxID=9643 RepID=A0A452R868_URSAM
MSAPDSLCSHGESLVCGTRSRSQSAVLRCIASPPTLPVQGAYRFLAPNAAAPSLFRLSPISVHGFHAPALLPQYSAPGDVHFVEIQNASSCVSGLVSVLFRPVTFSAECSKHFHRLYHNTRDCSTPAYYKRCARLLTRLAVSPLCSQT